MPPHGGPVLEFTALVVIAIAIVAVALLIARLSARDATTGPGQAQDAGAGLPRVVDRSIGMYLLRRARGEPTTGPRDEEPTTPALSESEVAHRIGSDVPATPPATQGSADPPWATKRASATSMGTVVRPAALTAAVVAEAGIEAAPSPPPSPPDIEPERMPATEPVSPAAVPEVRDRRPTRRTAGLALAGLGAMLALAIIAVPGFGDGIPGKVFNVTRVNPSHEASPGSDGQTAEPTEEVAGETSEPSDSSSPQTESAAPTPAQPTAAAGATPAPTPRTSPRVTLRPTPKPTARPTPTAKPTASPTPGPTPVVTPEPTPKPTPEPTPEVTPDPTP